MRQPGILALVIALMVVAVAMLPAIEATALVSKIGGARPVAGERVARSAARPATVSSSTQSACVAVGIGLLADVNNDGAVNILDIQLFAQRWKDPAQYDPLYDLAPDSPDGKINILDIVRAAGAMGSTCPLSFVDDAGDPVAKTAVRLLCYTSPNDLAPIADQWVQTNAFGRPLQTLPTNCNNVAALRQLHEQPSGKAGHGPAFQVYATSWPPGTREVKPLNSQVAIKQGWPLVLFNVVASLEWMPAAGSPIIDNLGQGMRDASAYLYDLTEGQMAFGTVNLYAGGQKWNAADFRFRAANDYRPSVYVGGIVDKSRSYMAPATGAETTYVSGEILLGRFWNGETATGPDAADPDKGRWFRPPAYRTLVHEWGHYALFLYDEYQKFDGPRKVKTYCTCNDLPQVGNVAGACGGVDPQLAASVMAYHYTASELWLEDAHGNPLSCIDTDQYVFHGTSDWKTLNQWADIQGLPIPWPLSSSPGVALDAGPDLGLAGDLFTFKSYVDAIATAAAAEVTTDLLIEPTEPTAPFTPDELNSLYPQVYMIEGSPTAPTRILYQGTTVGPRKVSGGPADPNELGQITHLGVGAESYARVYADRFLGTGSEAGERYVYPAPDGRDGDPPLSGDPLRLVRDSCQVDLDIVPQLTGPLLTGLTLQLTPSSPLRDRPIAQLCDPDASAGCPGDPSWRQAMNLVGGVWTATFTAPAGSELPHYGILHVQVPGGTDVIRWYQTAGGVGPAHMDANAPLRDGLVMVDATKPVPGDKNQVVVMPAASCTALQAPLPAGVQGIIGVPLDLDIVFPQSLTGNVVVTLFYDQTVIDRLGISEDQLEVLRFNRSRWQSVEVGKNEGQDQTLNWLVTDPIDEAGIYAVVWRAP